MRKLVTALAGLLLVVNVGFTQEKTVDLVEFLAAVYKGENKYKGGINETGFDWNGEPIDENRYWLHHYQLTLKLTEPGGANDVGNLVRDYLGIPRDTVPLQIDKEIYFIDVTSRMEFWDMDISKRVPMQSNSFLYLSNLSFTKGVHILNGGEQYDYITDPKTGDPLFRVYYNSEQEGEGVSQVSILNCLFKGPLTIEMKGNGIGDAIRIEESELNKVKVDAHQTSLNMRSNKISESLKISLIEKCQLVSNDLPKKVRVRGIQKELVIDRNTFDNTPSSQYIFREMQSERLGLYFPLIDDEILEDSLSFTYLLEEPHINHSWATEKTLPDTLTRRAYLSANLKDGAKLSFTGNRVLNSDYKNNIIFSGNSLESVEIIGNKLNSDVFLNQIHPEYIFKLYANTGIKGIDLSQLLLSEFSNVLQWENIKEEALNLKRRVIYDHNGSFVSGDPELFHIGSISSASPELLESEFHFDKLKATYQKLYDNYKTLGNTASANGCYAEMKVLETRWWKQQYKEQPSFENYFRWKLNEFLNFFTDYGTNPAKAVVKSIWVILIFSVFYLFFPSDWDVSNRSELLKRGKELFSKNRSRGILANLWFLLYTGFIHALNAITLSMNAFTTLGFGDIPTRGAARYVTIVQGLIGWFLLTIFSVSLINQVLG